MLCKTCPTQNDFLESGIMDLNDISFDSINYLDIKESLLPEKIFCAYPLSRNFRINIRHLEAGCFSFLPNLVELSLVKCSISELKNGQFDGLVNLTKLNLNVNRVKFVQPKAFADLKKLKFLSLSQNYLTRVNAKIFDELHCLEGLNLSKNLIEGVHKNAFDNLCQLKYLDLSSNKLKSVKANTYKNLGCLKTLDICNNKIESFDCGLFYVLQNLKLFSIKIQSDAFLKQNSEILWTICQKLMSNDYSNEHIYSEMSVMFYDENVTGLNINPVDIKKRAVRLESCDCIRLFFKIIFKNKENRIVKLTKKMFDRWHTVSELICSDKIFLCLKL